MAGGRVRVAGRLVTERSTTSGRVFVAGCEAKERTTKARAGPFYLLASNPCVLPEQSS
jgi:hypothetical protein